MQRLDAVPVAGTPALLNAVAYGLSPQRFASRHRERYGRTYQVQALGTSLLVTADPAHIRRVYSADASVFATTAATTLVEVMGRRSVLTVHGEPHTRARKLLSPPLAGQRLRAFGQAMQQLADRHVESLRAGQQVRALDLSTGFTLDVIARIVFGSDEREAAELKPLLSDLVQTLPALPIFVPHLQRGWFPPWARYTRLRDRAVRWIGDKIAARRARGRTQGDVLSLLLDVRYDDGSAMDDGEICDQLITLLLAGHETTSIAVANCVNRLHREPDVLARVRQELLGHSGLEAVQRLPYFSAVIDETLRIDTIVGDVTRVPLRDFELAEHLCVPARVPILIFIEALHHDPELYPEPSRFRPERFVERSYSPFEFMPFGGGVRRCLGAAFSDYETKVLLATLLTRCELSLLHTAPEPRVRRNITMGPKHGVPVRVTAVR